MTDQAKLNAIWAMLEGIKTAAADDSLDVAASLAQSIQDVLADLPIRQA